MALAGILKLPSLEGESPEGCRKLPSPPCFLVSAAISFRPRRGAFPCSVLWFICFCRFYYTGLCTDGYTIQVFSSL